MTPRPRSFIVAALLCATACQHYSARPLPMAASLAPALPDMPQGTVSASALSVPEVVRFALRNNPDLKAARAKRGVAQAQIIQSGILPNPSLAGAILPLISGVGVAPAWNIGITQDIKSLITYRSRRRAARDTAGQAAADLLWQEWQVAGQARQVATDLILIRRQLSAAEDAYAILAQRHAAMREALAHQDVTLVTAAPDLAAVQAARTARDTMAQRELQLHHQLAALLGLQPDAPLPLASEIALPPLDARQIRADLATLPQRRPDLLALRLGYAAQEEAVRQAILSQFPDLVLGGSATSDSSKVVNIGPEATVGLPVFDRGQGNIAVSRATREQLRAEYEARLATAAGEVAAALTEILQLEQQLSLARADLPAARLAASRAQAARGASAIDEAAYVDLISTRFTKEQDVMTLELALLDRQISLQTLLGSGLPSIDTLPRMETPR